MRVAPLPETFAAEVRGWQPGRALTTDELQTLQRALAAHRVLVLRGQSATTPDDLVSLALAFGEVAPAGEMYGLSFEHRQVLAVSNELNDKGYERGVAGSGALPWHADYSFMARAGKETFLEAVMLPADGGPDTIFCDMYAAYAALPADQRARLDGLRARHTLTAAGGYGQPSGDDAEVAARQRQVNPDLVYPDDGRGAWHPMVMVHPETGARALYVSTFVAEIEGLTPEQSNALTRELLAFADQPERVYRHRWQPHDLVIFDTVGTIHRRDLLRVADKRTMRQISTLLAA